MRYANDGLRFLLELAALAALVLLELVVFGSGVAAVWAADAETLAAVFGALVVAHLALTFVLGQRPGRAR